MDASELLSRYAAGERDFRGAALAGIDLTGAALLNADFSQADLRGTQLVGAQLRGARLEAADLSGANLEGASLEVNMDGLARVNLNRARLVGANLRGANLRSTLLRGADLSGATLSGTRLSGANATGVVLHAAMLADAELGSTVLLGADLRSAVLQNARLPGADLSGADLSDADLTGADLTRANLVGARLDRALLAGANLREAALPGQDNFGRTEGAAWPLGVTYVPDERAYNFALYSVHATAVTLLLFSPSDLVRPLQTASLDYRTNKTGRIWHCRLSEAEVWDAGARYYAYRVDGPAGGPAAGRFDPEKYLLDPYAPAVYLPPGCREGSTGPGPNAGKAALGEIPGPHWVPAASQPRPKRLRHTSDAIIYELHVRGFTISPTSGVAPESRGTFAGLIEKIPYLKELGVTIVELLPVTQYLPEAGGNYWGYMPLAFLALHREYGQEQTMPGLLDEFRRLVDALHEANMEVILDVVYNHTAEQGDAGPTLGFKGIDNGTYYLMEADHQTYRDDAGTGNVFRTAHPAARKLVLDSLRFWAQECHVDGFRFDLASIFTRRLDGSIDLDEPPVIAEISTDPAFLHTRLIAEAWDVSAYQLGRTFPGRTWQQWNGQFRDEVRQFVRGDSGLVPKLMSRLYGSCDDLFPDGLADAYRPFQSINFVTCHDGFCLYDLVSYNVKHNEANGHGNRDGSNENFSWNCGHEGDAGAPPDVLALRRRQVKNFCTLLFLANGTPMFCAGDEFLNTQGGNNNPYNQDNETTWLDWTLLEENRDVFRFFQKMIAFRKARGYIGGSRFWRERVRWYGVGPEPDLSHDSHTLAFSLRGPVVYGDDKSDEPQSLYVMINGYWEDLEFGIHEGYPGVWRRAIDTSRAAPDDILEAGCEEVVPELRYRVRARSVVVLVCN